MLADLRYLDTWIPKLFEQALGISVVRYEIMDMLLKHTSMRQHEIQEFLNFDRAAVTRHLQILEDKTYIIRKKNPADSREILVSITDTGKTAMTSCNAEHHAVIAMLTDSIEPARLLELSDVLKKMRNNVDTVLRKKDES